MRIHGSSEMNIQIMAISPDYLNIYSDIARTVLTKADLLKDEVQKLLSWMFSEAAIDPKQIVEVGFSLTIPTITCRSLFFFYLEVINYIKSYGIVLIVVLFKKKTYWIFARKNIYTHVFSQ